MVRVDVYYSSGKFAWSRSFPTWDAAESAAEAFRSDKRRYLAIIHWS